uniref:tRNA (guanine-N(7)-)-methyltransferase n=1 Tax=Ciona intestinalis TaxID=7719 RepID=H2XYT3_CIOIN|nr:tRNA (guanine-N(7)-)-methyltransferase [Ciona intestinalis]|eukprot:XP_002128586.1 tRNA (guanine-N(7)-)-methyltransferase [Ciona intestinalis]
MDEIENEIISKKLPRKKYFRQRAHSNPLGDHNVEYPISPRTMDWSKHYPAYFVNEKSENNEMESDDMTVRKVEVLDIGCGYGGLLIALSKLLPDTLITGMEIRVKVSDYVQERIQALRMAHVGTKEFQNVACIRTNAMKYLPNFFSKGQLKKTFILFPDPHFKKQKHKWRIVSSTLLAEYAYILCQGGLLYTITDVLEVHEWMVKHFSEHPLFDRVDDHELKDDACYKAMFVSTEEGKKVARNNGEKYPAVFRRNDFGFAGKSS